MNKFQKDLQTGNIGEMVAIKMLSKSPQTNTVMDVRNDQYFQDLDIDFLQLKKSGVVVKYEVKTDTQAHRTGNIAFEMSTSGNAGCLLKSQANYILYYLSESKEMYGFWLNEMKNYISRQLRTNTQFKQVPMGDSATGFLINIKELEKHDIIKKIDMSMYI